MTARRVLYFHTFVFFSFVTLSVGASLTFIFFPGLISFPHVIAASVLFLFGTITSWYLSGGCLFTAWENELREKERSGSSYYGVCFDRYAQHWFGIHMRPGVSKYIVIALFLLTIATGVLVG